MIRFNEPIDAIRLAKAVGANLNLRTDISAARVEHDELLGGVLYQGFTGVGGSIEMHTAGFAPNWLSRDLLWASFHYVFHQLECKKAFVKIQSDNEKSLAFASGLGFIPEARIIDAYPKADLILMSMRAEDCKWLRIRPRSIRSLDG